MSKAFGFHHEFEYEVKGKTYYVSATGDRYWYEGRQFTELSSLIITDESGEEIDDTHDDYAEIEEEAIYYEYEIHDANFDYFNDYFDPFLQEDVS